MVINKESSSVGSATCPARAGGAGEGARFYSLGQPVLGQRAPTGFQKEADEGMRWDRWIRKPIGPRGTLGEDAPACADVSSHLLL